jgi:hypothetical protein
MVGRLLATRQIEMMPTGGISLTTAHEFLDFGVFALGIGADLVDTNAVPEGRTVHAYRRARSVCVSFSHAIKATDHRSLRSRTTADLGPRLSLK